MGKGHYKGELRLYFNNILVTWMQRRCNKCGRFLGKRQYKYCRRYGFSNKERGTSYYEYQKEYNKTRRGLI